MTYQECMAECTRKRNESLAYLEGRKKAGAFPAYDSLVAATNDSYNECVQQCTIDYPSATPTTTPTTTPTPSKYITKKDVNYFRSEYQRKGYGTVDPISHLFGSMAHEQFYSRMQTWCIVIDSVCPDWFPLSEVQKVLINIVKDVYYKRAQYHYDKAVDQCRAIIGKVLDYVNELTSKINDEINKAKNYIQDNLIDPIKNAIDNDIKPKLTDVMNKLKDFDLKVGGLEKNVTDFQLKISDFGNALDSLKGNLSVFENKLNELDDLAESVKNRIKEAENLLGTHATAIEKLKQDIMQFHPHTKRIEDLERRVAALEGKPYEPEEEEEKEDEGWKFGIPDFLKF